MPNPKRTVKPSKEAPQGLSEEQQKALQEEMRNNQMLAKRAQVAMNLIPSIVQSHPDMCEEEIVAKAQRLSEIAFDRLLGVTFTKE